MRGRKRRILFFAYLALLAGSYLVRLLGVPPEPPPEHRLAQIPAVDDGGTPQSEPVDIAYRQWGPPETEAPVVVMLHGSPGSSGDFSSLGPAVGAARRVIAPDLPGFGFSSRTVPDYSIRAHADYVRQLLDRLGVQRFDVVGFSMGGGVAIHLAELEPDRVRSLVLLSSIGVQELELLGSYELNHAIHGAQLGGLWALHRLLPHFGALDDSMLSFEYARNFYDTDQRPLRNILQGLEVPTLILHGSDDPLVPIEAALEHQRIVPQSQLMLFDGDHFMVFMRSDEIAAPLETFLAEVDSGAGTARPQADPNRLAAAERPYDPTTRGSAAGFSLFIVLLLLAAATLVSEDLACIAAGLLVAQGAIGFLPAVFGCFIGIVAGDIGLYWTGRLIGHRALRMPPISWVLSEAHVAESAAWLERRGALVILLTRFIPGTRLPTYFSSGLLKTGFLRFTIFFLIASAIWTPLLVGLASLVGNRVFDYFEIFQRHALLGAAATAAVVWSILKLLPVLSTWRGRRLAVGLWRRSTHWEFWPWWLLYIPIVGWVIWLGLRFRSPTLFTLANPGIDCGGFAGESKGDLLRQIPGGNLPLWQRIEHTSSTETRLGQLGEFLDRSGVDLPIVLKPDSGERGLDVVVARTPEQAEAYVTKHSGPTLLQEYVPGEEFGVFYIRHPQVARGKVTSVAAKILPTVTGDGESTLERLVLADDRRVCQAPLFLASLEGRLDEVPAAGEVVSLGDLGTHSRGALFLDANDLRTPELDAAIDRIARRVDGFFLGRFDIRVPSPEHLRRGKELRVLELNGVTSEEAHMYDPRHGVTYAWRTLARQWRQAFEIGAANRRLGLQPDGLGALLASLRQYSRGKRTS